MCREELPVWQKFYAKHHPENFEILAISMDTQGAEVARRFTEAAGVTFPSAVDRAQGLWDLYGFPVVPNGFFVDEREFSATPKSVGSTLAIRRTWRPSTDPVRS